MPTLRTRQDRKRAFPNYDSPYRGLPTEVRILIWRYYFIQTITVHGPTLETDHLDTGRRDSTQHPNTEIPAFSDRVWPGIYQLPRIGPLLVNKEVYYEARPTMTGAITLHVPVLNVARFEWFVSIIPQNLIPRIRALRVDLSVTEITYLEYDVAGFLRSALLLRLDVLHLHIRVSLGSGSFYAQLPDNVARAYKKRISRHVWSIDSSGQIIDAIKRSDLGRMKIELWNAPSQVLTGLSDAAECIKMLRIDDLLYFQPARADGFRVLPINARKVIIITKA